MISAIVLSLVSTTFAATTPQYQTCSYLWSTAYPWVSSLLWIFLLFIVIWCQWSNSFPFIHLNLEYPLIILYINFPPSCSFSRCVTNSAPNQYTSIVYRVFNTPKRTCATTPVNDVFYNYQTTSFPAGSGLVSGGKVSFSLPSPYSHTPLFLTTSLL